MRLAEFLVDTSALVRLLRNPVVRSRWEPMIVTGVVAVCPLTELEFLYSARSKADRTRLVRQLRTIFTWVDMPERIFQRAAEVQATLTGKGTHRSAGPVDLLIAATAEAHQLTLLHYDRDFDQVAKVTGQLTRWLAPAGSLT